MSAAVDCCEIKLVSLGSGPWLLEHRAKRSQWIAGGERVVDDAAIPEDAEARAHRALQLRCPKCKYTWRGRYDDVLDWLTAATTQRIDSVPLRSLPV